jgi:hypothetical protein
MSELTIFSVYHSLKTKKFIEWNYQNTRLLNPGIDFDWMITDNAPPSLSERLTGGQFQFFPGVAMSPGAPDWMRPSILHANALNQMAPHLKTRFALFLDADFLVFYPGWIAAVLEHMKKNNLAVFGAPYHPRDYKKPRYFPSIPCMFVDGDKIPVREIDFRPQYLGVLAKIDGVVYEEPRLRKPWLKLKRFFLGERARIDSSRDTGSQIFMRYSDKVKYAYLTPVYKSPVPLLDKLLPESLSYTPKKPGYYSQIGFKEMGYFDAAGIGWEEYLWNGKPFGLHLRGTLKTLLTEEEQIKLAGEAVGSLVTRLNN